MTLPSSYAEEFEAAVARSERLGLRRSEFSLRVRTDCVDMVKTMPVLLDYFDRHRPEELMGQTGAIHFALVPLLYKKTGIPFELTTGWMERDGRKIFQHDETIIRRFLKDKFEAWRREGIPFHLWLTSPAYEVLDITYAMNLGMATTRKQCEQLVIYQSVRDVPGRNVYHPTVVGPEFFIESGAAPLISQATHQ